MWKNRCFLDPPCVSIGGPAGANSAFCCYRVAVIYIYHAFSSFSSAPATRFFSRWKKQTNGKLLNAGWLSGSIGGKGGGGKKGETQREGELLHLSLKGGGGRGGGGEMCHVLPVTPFTSSASSGMEVLPAASCSQIKWRITSRALRLFFRLHLHSAPLSGRNPSRGSFWFCFFFSWFFFFFVFPSIPYVCFWGECVVFLEDRYVIFTNYQPEIAPMFHWCPKRQLVNLKLQAHRSVNIAKSVV